MSFFSRLIRFECEEDDKPYFTDLGLDSDGLPSPGTKLGAFKSFDDLANKGEEKIVTLRRLLAPLPREGIPIYCVGLNYRTHAAEAELPIPSYPPLWTKPVASIAHPFEGIPVNEFCAKSFLDYEGELVFVTSKECRDVSPKDAKNYILGYTIGNDLSCRFFQLPENSGGQFFFAKAFDKFAPIGPTLISPEVFADNTSAYVLTRVNGEIRQKADLQKDMIFSPDMVLSHMSQGTTIPAGTAVMTGTAAGVGAFLKPRKFLQHGDVVEVEMQRVGTLTNTINFE
ncbi:related to bifunctional 4-hydroxyphenylacetate degradation enzyme [Fusarium torulosum]|uniref:Related to bifunctional 4-hydroxyphenylacetate degradation enzyme n=1 Tax=Fusarium torulosum TaxID=33205 RepID=A0AAE8SKP6_9HYPO|nr:related to bifunctional 4-hydroxyphenylacetate degradation enzyme [Fusarium torulosum]